MKKISSLLIVFVAQWGFAQTVLKTMKHLPGTGQTKSYTITPGEDADYNFYPPSYFNNKNGTITDSVTGLLWQQTDGGEMTVENAALYCDTLTLGGYTDWRLPDCHELLSILDHDRSNPAINTAYFTSTGAEYWWSSEKQSNDATKVWCANAGGGVGNHPKSETISAGGKKKFHVRAVRDQTTPLQIPNHFVNNGDGTVTDMLTSLMWLQVPYIDSIQWEDALTIAEGLNNSGHSDWRLPDIKELQSINDESRINPSIHTTFFTGVGIGKFWSSTSLPNQTNKAWYLDTKYGITTYQLKTNKLYVLCVRNANSSASIPQLTKPKSQGLNYKINNGILEVYASQPITYLQMLNNLGQTVLNFEVAPSQIDISKLVSGIYYVHVKCGNQYCYQKISIKN